MSPPPGGAAAASSFAAALGPLAALAGSISSRLDFHALIDQRGRMLQVATALPHLALVPERAVVTEAAGELFEWQLDCIASNAHFELKALIGEQMSLRLLQPDGRTKPWHGYVLQAAQLGGDGGLARYRLVMRPWLAFLAHRRDCFIWQDKTALEIIEELLADHPQARFRFDVQEPLRRRSLCTQYRESDLDFIHRLLAEEGLSYHFEHDDSGAAQGLARGSLHTWVVTDRQAARPHLGPARFAMQHPTARLPGQRDSITALAEHLAVQPNAVTRGAWNYKHLAGTTAERPSTLARGELPALEDYDGAGAYRYADALHAERAAELALGAWEQGMHRLEGQGGARHFEAGRTFDLVDHGVLDGTYTLRAVEHHITNNLGMQAAQLLQATELEHGTYKNHFDAVPATQPLLPRLVRRPTAPGAQTAQVVGLAGEPLSTDRDHRVLLQLAWQRGVAPLAGGLPHDERSPDTTGNAPGNERSGQWVRVALPWAGANWGAVAVPRIGTEVLVDFIEGDIDRPVVVGSLYNGADLPPFAAGVDSGVNHPGVISGLHSQALDGGGFNQWVVDDATGQLRMRLLCSYTLAEVGLGHLIQQPAPGAQRGAWRGSGFELACQAWACVRAAKGLLLSTVRQPATYGSAQGTQMQADAATALLHAGHGLGQALGEVARQARALHQVAHDAGEPMPRTLAALDVAQLGRHEGGVGGQAALQAVPGQRSLQDPVPALVDPLLVLESAAALALASDAQVTAYAGEDQAWTALSDVHLAATHTASLASGGTASVLAVQGGLQAIAAHGPVSLRAYDDSAELLARQDIRIVSTDDELHIQAPTVRITDGQALIELKGPDILMTMPGLWTAQHSTHEFMPAASQVAQLPAWGAADVQGPPLTMELNLHDEWLAPVPGAPYRVVFANGAVRTGRLDAQGHALLEGVPNLPAKVFYGEDPRKPEARVPMPANTFAAGSADNDEAQARIEEHLNALQAFWATQSAEVREMNTELNNETLEAGQENLWDYLDDAQQQRLRALLLNTGEKGALS